MQAALAQRPTTNSAARAERDGDMSEMARQTLEQHPHFRGRCSNLSFEQSGRTLRIGGRLPSFYLKQLVQETLRHLPGVQTLRNDIQVVRSDGYVSQ